ncbi:hypothetical protein VB779_02110 [Haloarculaceae archaeon H-GB11]|nr:hypothetical protein [Haloarculaceae archaeon H-GB11]
MGEQESEERQKSRRSRQIQRISEWFVPSLDSEEWQEKFPANAENVEKSTTALAREYHDLTNPAFISTTVLVFLLLVVDFLMYLNGQVYGLFIDLWAALFLVFPSLKGRFVISTLAEGDEDAVRLLEAQEMVANNIGVGLLALGFVIQIITVQFLGRTEFFANNILTNSLPGFVTGIFLLIALAVTLKVLGRLRSIKLEQREHHF